MRSVTATVLTAVLIMALVGPPPVSAEPQEASTPEIRAQIEALTAKVAALNATLGAAVSQIAALATAIVTLQAQMATGGHGAIASQAVLAALPHANGAMPAPSVLPEITRSLFELALRIRDIVPCDRAAQNFAHVRGGAALQRHDDRVVHVAYVKGRHAVMLA